MRKTSIGVIVFLVLGVPAFLCAQEYKTIFQKQYSIPEYKGPSCSTVSLFGAVQFQDFEERDHFYLNIFSPRAVRRFNQPEDRSALRQQWKDFLGMDIFYPYFQVQELKHKVENKGKIEIFSMKGKPEIDESKQQVNYIFKKRF